MKAWDANASTLAPDTYWGLPKEQRDELYQWVLAHGVPDKWIGRVELDVIDIPLLRIFYLDTDVDPYPPECLPYHPPVEIALKHPVPDFVGAW